MLGDLTHGISIAFSSQTRGDRGISYCCWLGHPGSRGSEARREHETGIVMDMQQFGSQGDMLENPTKHRLVSTAQETKQ